MQTKILYLFTRTPLHVGAGASVGAIDQPVQRERHTGFPIIPATSLKGSFADAWNDGLKDEEADKNGKISRVRVTNKGEHSESAWLFGSDNDKHAAAGSLLFSEARVLAFPVRSAKGSYGWITCPLMLQRAKRDGVLCSAIPTAEPKDDEAIFNESGPLSLNVNVKGVERTQIVLEEYTFTNTNAYPGELAKELAGLIRDELFQSITDRLVILSNGMMSHFVSTTCEIAQHVRINDETGTAEEGGLFNQENVPSETLFYSVLHATNGRGPQFGPKGSDMKTAGQAHRAFEDMLKGKIFQFGGDASTGLGFCTVEMK
jgi:CRISPR-associated protein Cmr4